MITLFLDKVSFSYTGKENDWAIQNVNFEAKQGEITAIVGPSGGGKSTIANLISRFLGRYYWQC